MITSIGQVWIPKLQRAQWCVRWKTESMPASAFWYYDTEAEAKAVEQALKEVPKLKP